MVRKTFSNTTDWVCGAVNAEDILRKILCVFHFTTSLNISGATFINDLDIMQLRAIPVLDSFNTMYIPFTSYRVLQRRAEMLIFCQLILIRCRVTFSILE